MESYTFKSVTFGGFDKQDVVRYLEQASRESTEAIEKLQQENTALQEELQKLRQELQVLKLCSVEQESALSEKDAALARCAAENAELSSCRAQLESLTAEMEALRPNAQAYLEFRDRIGNIECEAQQRAAALESATSARLHRLTADFRRQYQQLSETFSSASSYITSELRKVEVNLSQMPRALDQMNADLGALEAMLPEDSDKT